MSLPTTLIDLDAIEPPTSVESSQFEEDQLEKFARLLLQADDTVRPIVLSRINPISFRLLEGYFEYFAAIKAQELNPQFTAIQAYVVPANLEAAFLEQYQFLRSLSSSTSTEKATPEFIEQAPKPIAEVSPQPQNLEQLEKAVNQLGQKITSIERVTSELQIILNQLQQLPKTFETQINYALQGVVQQISTKVDESLKATKKNSSQDKNKAIHDQDPKIVEILNDLNTMNLNSLTEKLSKSKNNRFAEPIFNRRSEQLFTSISDVMTVKGKRGGKITIDIMQKIIEKW